MKKWLRIGLFACFLCFFLGFKSEVKAQDTLSAFHLVAPSDSTLWGVSQFCQGVREFKWQTSVPSVPAVVGYSLSFYLPNQPTLPAWTWPATGTLTDTFALIPEDSINAFILRMGSSVRQTLTLSWKVIAENDSTKLKRASENQFGVTFLPEVDSLGIPILLGPADSLALNIPRINPLQLTFSWKTAFFNIVHPINPTVYQLEFDTSATFNNPIRVWTTTDTSILFNRGALDTLAINSGISRLNQQKMIYWRVVANQCGITFVNSRVSSLWITRIDEQIQSFNLITPNFGQSLIIKENTNSTLFFNWTSPISNASSLPIQTELLIDSLSGDFSQPWFRVSVPVGDTQMLMNSGIIKQRLINSGVGFNVNMPYKWAVRVNNGITQRVSGNTNLIYFERKIDSISQFATVLPFDSLRLEIPQSGSISNTFVWQPTNHSLGDTVKYKWKFWTLNSTAQSPLIQIESGLSGMQNILTLNVALWNAVLDAAGIGLNQMVEGNWAVEATAGGISKWSDSIRYLRFVRVIDSLSNFNFIAPLNGTAIQLAQLANQTVRISWNKSVSLRQHPVLYTLKMDTIGGSGNAALFTTQIQNDSVYSIGNGQLNSLLQSIGVGVGGSRLFRITIEATAGSQQKSAMTALDINFQRVQDSIGVFNLVSPSNNSTIWVGHNLPAIAFKWRKPSAFPDSLRYQILFDVPSGNFSAPIFDEFAGSDTSYTLTGGKLDSLLAGLGVLQGQSYPLKWAIQARIGNTTRLSAMFNLVLKRFSDSLSNFRLLSPADSALLIVTGTPTTTFSLTWESSKSTSTAPVTFTCYFDLLGGNFSNPFFTKSAGTDTTVSIAYQEMANALSTLGVNPGDTGNYVWTVKADSGPLTLQAEKPYFMRLGWNFFTSTSAIPFAVSVFPNPVNDWLWIKTADAGLITYRLMDAVGKMVYQGIQNFSSNSAINLADLKPGIYFLSLYQGNQAQTIKLVKH